MVRKGANVEDIKTTKSEFSSQERNGSPETPGSDDGGDTEDIEDRV